MKQRYKSRIATLKQELENVNSIQVFRYCHRQITDVSTSIKSMLGVHEEKIQRQEQIDELSLRN
ncbi:MAG: hypothetical protein CM15mV8_1650 [Caudoviricetes sp.]|nr:MAG: hypothetical protein CM15mV8_1650 [Caudoviricetes sp.]